MRGPDPTPFKACQPVKRLHAMECLGPRLSYPHWHSGPNMNWNLNWNWISKVGGCALVLASAWVFLILVLSLG